MTENFDLIGAGWRFPLGVDGRGGLALSRGIDEIEEAIGIIISTPKGHRVMRPEFGCRIHELVYEPLTPNTLSAAAHYVREALAWWEPRIEVIDVIAEPDVGQEGCMVVLMHYRVRATHDERALVYPFYTIPVED